MPERATIFQLVQLGVESAGAPGTAVAVTKRFQSIGLEPEPSPNLDTFKPTGQKFLGVAVLGQESSAFRISGRVSFEELHYLLASLMSNVAPTTPGTPAAATARDWTYVSASSAADTPASYTVEAGALGATDGDRYAGLYVAELGIVFTRQSIEVNGTGFAQQIVNPVTITTGGVTALPVVPAQPKLTDIFFDTTLAGIGTTKLLRCFRAEWRYANRFAPIWPINSANPSWERVAETDPTMTATLRLVRDAQGMAFYNTYMRQGSNGFLRILNRGNYIDALTGIAITSSTSASPPVWTSGAAHNLVVGDVIVISGNSIAGYNRQWIVATAPTGTTFTLTDPLTMLPQSNLGASTGGTLAEQVNPYRVQIDMNGVVTAAGSTQDEQGLQTYEVTLGAQHDQSWGKSHQVVVTNKQTAL